MRSLVFGLDRVGGANIDDAAVNTAPKFKNEKAHNRQMLIIAMKRKVSLILGARGAMGAVESGVILFESYYVLWMLLSLVWCAPDQVDSTRLTSPLTRVQQLKKGSEEMLTESIPVAHYDDDKCWPPSPIDCQQQQHSEFLLFYYSPIIFILNRRRQHIRNE